MATPALSFSPRSRSAFLSSSGSRLGPQDPRGTRTAPSLLSSQERRPHPALYFIPLPRMHRCVWIQGHYIWLQSSFMPLPGC